jgi:hypothetical protein
LKEKFWRITTKSRGKKNSALLAVAYTILQLVYQVLRTGQPYLDRQAPALCGQQKDRLIRHHVRRLGNLRSEFIRSAPALVHRRHYPGADRNQEKCVFSEEPLQLDTVGIVRHSAKLT